MPVSNNKEKNKSLLIEDDITDLSVSDAINEAFDNVELSTIGKLCLDARVNKSLTQEQAGALLKVRVKIIKDFENGDQIDLPGLAYKIGFVRSYARLLGLDGDLLVNEFKESLELDSFKEEYKFLSPEIQSSKILPLGAVISFFVALLIYSGWYYSDRSNNINLVSNEKNYDDNSKTPALVNNNYVIIEEDFGVKNTDSYAADKSVKEVKNNFKENINSKETANNFDQNNDVFVNEKVKSTNIENQGNQMSAEANERDPTTEMVLKAIGNSWVEIEDIDGNVLMTRLMRPGEIYVVPNIDGLTFNTGNAGALSISQGNTVISSLGEIGEIITARPLNIKAFANQKLD